MCKKVQFACDVEFVSTFANEEYDRTAQEVAKLTYKDMLELLTMKSQWRREMEKMLAEREESSSLDENASASSSSSSSSLTSSTTSAVVNDNTNNSPTSRLFNVQEICI